MTGQLGFVDHVLVGSGSRRKDHLAEIDALIDWSEIEHLLQPLRSGRMGRPAYRVMSMFKLLLLQRWYGLSDEAMEDALADRLSFRRFAGFGLEEAIPDATTICRFRSDLVEADLGEALFAAAGRSLDAKGLLVRQGTLIDASLMPAAVADRASSLVVEPPKSIRRRDGPRRVIGRRLVTSFTSRSTKAQGLFVRHG